MFKNEAIEQNEFIFDFFFLFCFFFFFNQGSVQLKYLNFFRYIFYLTNILKEINVFKFKFILNIKLKNKTFGWVS